MEPTSTAADLTAGFISGAISTLAVHPVDTVLTRFQARGFGNGAIALLEARTMALSLGPTSLWRGAPALIGAAPFQNALLMAGYGAGRRWSSGNDEAKQDRLAAVFVGGTVGGVLQCLVASPAELFKVQRQVVDMMGGKNQRSITAGMGATMLRDGIPHGVWFASYEWCKSYLGGPEGEQEGAGENKQQQQSMAVPLLSGAFAASVAWGVGYPFDIIKTRIQAGRATGVTEAARDIIARGQLEGGGIAVVRNLYRGFGLKLARAVPASAIGFVCYEYALKLIEGAMA